MQLHNFKISFLFTQLSEEESASGSDIDNQQDRSKQSKR